MTLDEILAAEIPNADKARACLAWVSEGDGADPRVPGYLAAAQTFGMLAVADALGWLQEDYRQVNPL